MARKTITQITDDVDGSKDAQEVFFSFDGIDYTIDLGKKNKAAFEKAMATYLEAAAKAPRRNPKKVSTANDARRDLSVIREWAKNQGLNVSDRGRVAQSTIDKYEAAH
ncbi:Lsr2 family protein [Nocardioides sp. InS609-2]|uniref:histone-like nucleoid-structuring protein Lsr2 n=1 Tax=Nocardioides sp. InS609-2 TaxID=2760705 RepID=UPI0020BFA685|nr:Lsr2 family protein [Nocardioides sp. InS609-2]